MAKTARLAISNAFQCLRHNWQGIFILAIQTYILMYVAEFLLKFFSDKLLGTAFLEIWKIDLIQSFNLFSRNHIPINEIGIDPLYNALMLFVNAAISIWLLAPLITALSRTVILSESFDQRLITRLTEKRCLKVAMISFMSIVLLFSCFFYMLDTDRSIALSIAFVAQFILAFYILLRVSYLVPAIAIDYPLSTLKQALVLSQNKTWSVFKVFFLTYLSYAVLLFAVGFLFHLTRGVLADEIQIILFSVLDVLINILFIGVIFTAAIASTYKQFQK